MEPPVILWVISFSPGFIFSILAGVVCEGQVDAVPTGPCATHLGILAALEEGCHADETNVVVPHDGILSLVAREFENVLKDCHGVNNQQAGKHDH